MATKVHPSIEKITLYRTQWEDGVPPQYWIQVNDQQEVIASASDLALTVRRILTDPSFGGRIELSSLRKAQGFMEIYTTAVSPATSI